MVEQFLGWTATILFSCITIPQFIKTIKTKDITGVSIWQYILFIIANMVALIYAMMISQYPLIIKYILAIGLTFPYIFLYYRIKYEQRIRQSNKSSKKNNLDESSLECSRFTKSL